jgi:spore coat polysaccharide biosynthesis protein SpsF
MPAASSLPLFEIAADGGREVGYGHVGRCLAIAEQLDGRARFALGDRAARRFVTERGGLLEHEGQDPAVVLLDRCAPTSESDVAALHASGRRVALLDDMGSGRRVADLVIDPPTAVSWPPTGGRRLAGFEYVLLRREVMEAVRDPAPRGVLVAMGGSDPAGLTVPLCEALAAASLPVTAALGPSYSAPAPDGVRVLRARGDVEQGAFVTALAGASLLVAGFGHTLLEAAYLGVPAVAIITREEHRPHAFAFCQSATATPVDMSAAVRPAEFVRLVEALLGDAARREALGRRGRSLVDGGGARRVARELLALA